MSWKATAYVAELIDNITRSEKLLMLCLANRYNDDEGCAWVSLPRLAREALMSDRTAHQAIDGLVRKGLLIVGERPGQSSVYLLTGLSGKEASTAKTAGVNNWRSTADPATTRAKTAGVVPQKKLITSDDLNLSAADEQEPSLEPAVNEPAGLAARGSIASSTREGTVRSIDVGSGGEKATLARRGGDMDAFGRALLAQRLHPATLDKLAECGVGFDVGHYERDESVITIAVPDFELWRRLVEPPTCDMLKRAAEEAGFDRCNVIKVDAVA